MASKKIFMSFTTALTMLLIAWRKHHSESSSTGFVTSLLMLNIVTIWCYHAYVYPHFFSQLKNIPMLSHYSCIGGHMWLGGLEEPYVCSRFRDWVEESPTELVRFFDLRHVEHVVCLSHASLQELLTTKCYDYGKSVFLKTGSNRAILGDGLLLAEGDLHKRQRKQINPAFSFRHVKNLVPVFWSFSTALTRAVEAQRDTQSSKIVIEPNVWTSRATLDMIGKAGLDRSFEALAKPDRGLARAYSNLFALDSPFAFIFRLLECVIPSQLLLALPSRKIQEFKVNLGAIRQSCHEMVQEKQATLRKSADTPSVDILSAMLSSSEVSFTEDQLVEHLLTFLAAGHETLASGMAWALYILCKRPEVERRLREEIWAHIEAGAWETDSETTITADQLANMPYLQAFCNEVLRLFPPIPMTVREALVDTSLAGQPIPKGTNVVVSIWGTNASTAFWGADAAEFRPERWLESPSGGCKSNYALQTFLAGPRSCIGSNFAKHEFQCLVAAWVGRLQTRFAKDTEGWKEPTPHGVAGISAKPSPGWKVEVEVLDRRGAGA